MGKKQLSSLSSRTQKKTEKHHKRGATASPNLEDPQTATLPRELLLSKKGIMDKVQSIPLVEVCAQDVKRCSQVVYGNEDALRKETDRILENPQMKDLLLKRIKENPASVHPLANRQIFSFKASERKQAQEKIAALCSAITSYAEAVRYGYEENGIIFEQKKAAMERNLQKPLDAQQKKALPPNEQTTDLVRDEPSVQKYYERVLYWSKFVYGNSRALQKQMEEVLKNPDMGEQFLWTLATYPTNFHKFAGHNICGFKNHDRKYAENRLPQLHDAFESFVSTVREKTVYFSQRREMLRNRTDVSKNQQQEVKQKLHKTQERQRAPQRNTQPDRSEGAAAHATVSSVKTSLSNEKMVGMIKSKPSVQKCYEHVRYLGRVVYGDWYALQKPMEDILKNPAMGEKISQKVAKDPASFHKLAGRNLCGFKNTERISAENHLSRLREAFKNYTEAVQESKEIILQEQEKQQHFVVSESQKKGAEQKFQKPQERQHTQQRHVQQHKARSGKGVAFAL